MNGKIQAQTSDASVNVESASVAHLGTRCFLCPREIGESEPRRFYQGKNAMLLGHTGCIDKFETDQRRAEEQKRLCPPAPPAQPEATAQAGPPGPDVETVVLPRSGPTHIRFNTFADLQDWIVRSGPIDPQVAVSLGDALLHDGRS